MLLACHTGYDGELSYGADLGAGSSASGSVRRLDQIAAAPSAIDGR